MKNTATAAEDRPRPSPAWLEALDLFDADLRRRGMAAKTKRAYGIDLGQFALWCTAQGLEPGTVAPRTLRRYAAALSEHGAVPATVARKLAALRACFRTLREQGVVAQNPADLVASPKRPQTLPRVLRADELAALLDRIPATTPLELRDRALFELAYASGLRAEELVGLDVTSLGFDAEEVRVEGKGAKTRIVPVGETALRALTRYLERARPALAERPGRARALPLEVRAAPLDERRAPAAEGVGAPRGAPGRGLAARAAPLVRDPSPRRGRRPARDPGAPRPQLALHDADLHSGRVGAPAVRLCTQSPASLSARPPGPVEANVKAIELRDLWRRYKDDGDERARERLVVAYSPLVKYVSGRMASGLPAHVDEADLISYGLVGLINAIERFEPARAVKFETYAMTRVKGAIIDELRTLDWVPRSVRARARQIERANAKLEHTLQRAPTDEEMAAELDLSVEEFQSALLQISTSTVAALDELWTVGDSSGDQVSLLDTLTDENAPDPAAVMDQTELKERIAEAIRRLPERERLVIALYYYENLTLREIGDVLSVTESRVSQLHTKAVLRLRSRLGD